MAVENHELYKLILQHEPTIGSGDTSKCLPGWINSFLNWHKEGKGQTLSAHAVSALAHTLVAQNERIKRLIKERDKLQKDYDASTLDI